MRVVRPGLQNVEEDQSEGEHGKVCTFGRAIAPDGEKVSVMRWRPSAEERQRIEDGEDLFLYIAGEQVVQVQLEVGSNYFAYEVGNG